MNQNTISILLYCINQQYKYINYVINSFDTIIDKFYIIHFDENILTDMNKDKIINLNIKDYDFNLNKVYNSIKQQSKIWIIWQSHYFFNNNKKKEFLDLLDKVKNTHDIIYIYGVNLYLDISHTLQDKQYCCKNGNCYLINNTVTMNENGNENENMYYFTLKKDNKKILYNLYSNDEYYFFNFVFTLTEDIMLIDAFVDEYIEFIFLNKIYINFDIWYFNRTNNNVAYGQKYIMNELLLLLKQNKIIKHNFILPYMKLDNSNNGLSLNVKSDDTISTDDTLSPQNINTINKYIIHDNTNRIELININKLYYNYTITIITLVRNNKHYLRESMLSLLNQTNDKWLCIIINDGSSYDVSYDDFLISEQEQKYKCKFNIINLKEWNGLVKCHKLALMHCTTDIVGILDVDDVIEKNAIDEILKVYNSTKQENIYIYSNFYFCDDVMKKINLGYCNTVKTCVLNDRCLSHFRTFKLKYYYLTEGYDDDLQFGAEDQDILIKMETICTPIFLNLPLYLYRTNIQQGSISSLKQLSIYSLYISIFKNIYSRYNNLNMKLYIYKDINQRIYKHKYLLPVTLNNIKYYCEICSNYIFIFDASKIENIQTYIEKYIATNINVYDVNINWNYLKSKFEFSENKLIIKDFCKIHPSVYFNNIYIINLQKDDKKRERMKVLFETLNIKYEFFNAIYGKAEPHISIYSEKYKDILKTPGVYGYSLTMIKIFEDAIKKKYKKILVCDDDIIFHKDFLNLFDQNIRKIPFDWKVLFLGISGPWSIPFVNKDFKAFNFTKSFITNFFNCDGSYCMGYDLNIMLKLIEISNEFTLPFDTAMIKYFNANNIDNIYGFYPYLVIADTTTSDITEREQDILKNFNGYQYRFRINMNNFDLQSMLNKNYDSIYTNPYPKVSIIMTLYNKEKYVEYAIKSILKQTYKNLEIIIIEDCSTDNSKQIIQQFKNHDNIKILYNTENLGCYKSRNKGIIASTGEIIGFQDSDDYAISTKIEKQIKFMIQNKLLMVGCNMIRSHIENINYNDDATILLDVKNTLQHIAMVCCTNKFGYPTLLIKKSLFDKYGLYIERRKGMDMEFPERILFRECGILFKQGESSWEYFDKCDNNIYIKLDDLLVISSEMGENNISNNIVSDSYLKNKEWRKEYK